MVTKEDGSTEEIEADAIVIATGSSPAQIPIFPMMASHYKMKH